jgi:glycosyltransferase involved in cell wall biosynthesis
MRILYVYDGEWPKGATRVEKETRALAGCGHEVHLVARNLHNAPARESEPWMTVWRLPRLPLRPLRYALNFPLFLNPVWLRRMAHVARAVRPELILVCDLPLALPAVRLGERLGIPVHYDMAEIYPEFLRSLRQFERMGPVKRLVRTPALADWMERQVLPRLAAVYVVSEESRARCVRLGVAPERTVIVGNTPPNSAVLRERVPVPADIADLVAAGREILLFVGILIGDRGVMEAVQAVARLRERRPGVALVVVGDGTERPRLEEAVAGLGLGAHVRLVGWKQHADLSGYYQAARIGLLPFRDSPHVRLTLANKLFDYMGAGLPVLAADLPPNRRVLAETGAGRLHRADDPDDLAAQALEMLDAPQAREEMGRRGIEAVRTSWCWERDVERLCQAVRTLR